MERTPFAITLDPNTSLANHTELAHDETDLCRSLATVQPRLPGRREHSGLALSC